MKNWYKCEQCGERAVYRNDDESWKTKCPVCWKLESGIKLTNSDRLARKLIGDIKGLKQTVDILHGIIQRKEMTASYNNKVKLDKKLLTQVISLCHPDKHGGLDVANEVTRKLIEMRKMVDR